MNKEEKIKITIIMVLQSVKVLKISFILNGIRIHYYLFYIT